MIQAILFLVFLNGPQSRLDPERFEIIELKGINSPTALLWHNRELWLGADFLDPRPGIYRWFPGDDGSHRAGLVYLMLQEGLEAFGVRGRGLVVVSSKLFDKDKSNWENQLVFLDQDGQQLERHRVKISNLCPDKSRDCGITSAVATPDGNWWMVSRKERSNLYLVSGSGEELEPIKQVELLYNRKPAEISEMHLVDDRLVFLVQNRWVLGSLPQSQLFPATARVELEPYFDFSHLRKKIEAGPQFMVAQGLAEGFTFDGQGNLWVLLNSRGFSFNRFPGDMETDKPQLLKFTIGVDPLPDDKQDESKKE